MYKAFVEWRIRIYIMKKWIYKGVLLLGCLLICLTLSGRAAGAYTEEEKQSAKSWLSAHGYSPDRGGAAQAYQDYLDGKLNVPGAEKYVAKNGSKDSSGQKKKKKKASAKHKKNRKKKKSNRAKAAAGNDNGETAQPTETIAAGTSGEPMTTDGSTGGSDGLPAAADAAKTPGTASAENKAVQDPSGAEDQENGTSAGTSGQNVHKSSRASADTRKRAARERRMMKKAVSYALPAGVLVIVLVAGVLYSKRKK